MDFFELLPDVEQLQEEAVRKTNFFHGTHTLDEACQRLKEARDADAEVKYRAALLFYKESGAVTAENVTRFRHQAMSTMVNLQRSLLTAVRQSPVSQCWSEMLRYTRPEDREPNPMVDWLDDAIWEGVKLFCHYVKALDKGYRVYMLDLAVEADQALGVPVKGVSVGVYWSLDASELEEDVMKEETKQTLERLASRTSRPQALPASETRKDEEKQEGEEATMQVEEVTVQQQLGAPAGMKV